MSVRKITTHEATVQTATVEVKTLTISGRQVTLSVFRQLVREPVIDLETVKLEGVPWGHVQYFPESWCADRRGRGHLHVVWQKGNELRRACVDPLARGPRASYTPVTFNNAWLGVENHTDRRDDAYAVAFGVLAAEDPAGVRFEPLSPGQYGGSLDGSYSIDRAGLTWRHAEGAVYPDGDPRKVLRLVAQLVAHRDGRWGHRGENLSPQLSLLRQEVCRFSDDDPPPAGAQALEDLRAARAAVQDATAAVRAMEASYADLYVQLAALPQLFIAT